MIEMPQTEVMAAGLAKQVIREQWALLKALENLQREAGRAALAAKEPQP